MNSMIKSCLIMYGTHCKEVDSYHETSTTQIQIITRAAYTLCTPMVCQWNIES